MEEPFNLLSFEDNWMKKDLSSKFKYLTSIHSIFSDQRFRGILFRDLFACIINRKFQSSFTNINKTTLTRNVLNTPITLG